MNTKASPSINDGYTKADPHEPMFVLLARDPQAPMLVRQWARDRRLRMGEDDPKVTEAFAIADAMEAYRVTERPLEQDIPRDGEHVPDPEEFRTDYRNRVEVEPGEDKSQNVVFGDVVASGDPMDKSDADPE